MKLDGQKRLLLIGKTGSGKSFLARYLLQLMENAGYRIAIVDPKIDWMARHVDEKTINLEYGKPPGTIDHPVLIRDYKFHPEYRVSIIHPVEWSEELGQYLKDGLYARDLIYYFDEGTQLVNANFVPTEFNIIESQGRSKNVGVWYGTQRTVRIPVLVKDQASIIILMRVTSLKDREVIAPYMNTEAHPEIIDKPLPPRYFWMYDDSTDETILYAPLNLEEKHATKAG